MQMRKLGGRIVFPQLGEDAVFDDQGLVEAIVASERNIAHRIIEEFMLAANMAVATALEFRLTGGHVRAEGDLDFRGTLGVDKSAPVGFTAIRIVPELETGASEEQLATLLKLEAGVTVFREFHNVIVAHYTLCPHA